MPKYRKFDPEDVRLVGNTSLPLSPEERRSRQRLVEGFEPIYEKILAALLEHYGLSKVDENRWYLLALNLAMDHVPGFIYGPRPRGRKLSDDWFALVAEIDIIRTEHRVGIAKACDLLSERKRAPWVRDSRVLEATYHNHRRRIRGDPFLKDLYDDWNTFRNDMMRGNTDISADDDTVLRVAELRDHFVEMFRLFTRPIPIHSKKTYSSLYVIDRTTDN